MVAKESCISWNDADERLLCDMIVLYECIYEKRRRISSFELKPSSFCFYREKRF